MELTAEDNKLVTLARATRMRVGSAQGAALRDLDGRTYAAATVELPSLQVSAVGAVLAMALAGGSKGAEAVVLLGTEEVPDQDRAALRDFAGPGVPVHLGTVAGRIESTATT
jgi:hypothetical protein